MFGNRACQTMTMIDLWAVAKAVQLYQRGNCDRNCYL
jgi:hypothetical protein